MRYELFEEVSQYKLVRGESQLVNRNDGDDAKKSFGFVSSSPCDNRCGMPRLEEPSNGTLPLCNRSTDHVKYCQNHEISI